MGTNREAATAVELSASKLSEIKWKYTLFSAEQRASIGRYAAEHGNSFTVKKFKSDFEQGLGD